MIGFIIALVSGALMSIQGVFNTEVSKQTGLWTASSFVQFTGLLTCLAVWIFAERDQSFLSLMKVSPKYVLLGGVMGAGITFTVIKSIGLLGPFGVEKTGFQWMKLAGVVLFVAGILIFKWKS